MSSKEVTLTCDGHYLTLLGIFERLLEKGSLVDCTLTAEGRSLRAHKEVLSAFSPFFQLLFDEADEKDPTIVLSGFSYQDLSALIDYVYYGRVKIPVDRVENLINCAQSLHMKGLGGQDKDEFENKNAQSNAITSRINAPCVAQRKCIDKRESTSVSTARTALEIQSHSHRVSQDPPASIRKIPGDSTETCSNLSQASSVDCERSGSNVPPLPYEQTISSVNNSAITPAHAMNRESPRSNVQMFAPECELDVIKREGDGNRGVSACQLGRNSSKGEDGEAILGLSAEIKMNDGQNLYGSLPVEQRCSDFPSLPPANIPSEVVNPSCSRSTANDSPPMNEQSRDMNFAPSEYSSSPSGTRENYMLTSEVFIKTEPFAEDDDLTEETENELEEMEVFEGEMESERQEESFQNSGSSKDDSFNTEDVPDFPVSQMLPIRSKHLYNAQYDKFKKWCWKKKVSECTESVLMGYFAEESTTVKSSTLWSHYSMLKATLAINEDVDISKFVKLTTFLKRKNVGYKPKKSKIFTREDLQTFLNEAPDDKYLLMKVVAIFGIAGGCRRDELVRLTLDDIQDVEAAIIVTIPATETASGRTFPILGNKYFLQIVRKYLSLRPLCDHNRLFLNYIGGKCARQALGINKFGKVPSQIAAFLNLPEPESYTGHSFRKTSATFLVDTGGVGTNVKQHGGWKSANVSEETYMGNSRADWR